MATTIGAALERLSGQPRVREFLLAAVRENHLSHAYLFTGAPGSGQLETARALAQCIVCPQGGDGTCDECIRVAHGTHPDVHLIAPEGISSYLVEQVRNLIDDVQLAPVRSTAKVYILERAELLRGAPANALLKTIEEPPQGVVFILIARSVDAVLPTIASRCQLVPFRVVPPASAAANLEQTTGASGMEARIALAVAGTPEHAAEFLASPGRREARRLMLRTISELPRDDGWDVLSSAQELIAAVRVPVSETREALSAMAEQDSDFLSPKAMKRMEDAQKRELSARERSGMMELLAAAESLLRDALVYAENAGTENGPVNAGVAEGVGRLSVKAGPVGLIHALDVIRRAADDVAHNVSPQLALEAMLFSLKEALG